MTGAHRILCIEDDARLRRLLIEDLTDAGYDAIEADSAASGIKAFFTHAPTLVLCDIRMPGISGFDLFERLRLLDATLFGASFIFLTALADRDSELRGRRLGADDYITKPVDHEILREVIRVRLGARPRSRRPPPMSLRQAELLVAWMAGPLQSPPASLASMFRGRSADLADADGATAPSPDVQLLPPMLDHISLGVTILDGRGIIKYINQSAAQLLGRMRTDMVGSRASPTLIAFARAHFDNAHGDGARLSAARLRVAPDRPEFTAIARLTGGNLEENDSVTVLLPAMPSARPAFSELLTSLFGLTPAERLLAAELGSGTNLADIASRRAVSMGTVRSQLKSIFGKVGVTRQSDLVRTLLTLQMAVGGSE